jgi:hypothetical protein
MKKLLIIVLLFSAVNIFAQKSSNIIKYLPQITEGYLVLKNTANVKYWEVNIIQRTYDEDGSFSDKVVETENLVKKNYCLVPAQYMATPNYLISVTANLNDGTSTNEVVEISTQIPGGGHYNLAPSKTCNGSTYAYSIFQYINTNNGSSYFSLQPGYNINPSTGEGTPYYQYFDAVMFQQIDLSEIIYNGLTPSSGIPFSDYYDIYTYTQLLPDNINVICVDNLSAPNKQYCDGMDNVITSQKVYGLRKSIGPWYRDSYNSSDCNVSIQTPSVTLGNPVASLNDAIAIFNTNIGWPGNCEMHDLVCIPSCFAGYTIPHAGEIHDVKWDKWLIAFLARLDELRNRLKLDTTIHNLSITCLSFDCGELFNMTAAEIRLYNPELILNPGLYCAGMQLEDGSYYPVVFDVSGDQVNINALSNFLTATVFPNPFGGNNFSLNLSASKDLSFKYNLIDNKGKIIYQSGYKIAAGANESVTIKPNCEIPKGMLINSFIFEDGSQSSVISIKM